MDKTGCYLYCSVFNILNLCLCMIGAAVFGKFSLMILSVIGVCCAGVTVSFFLDTSYTISYNVTSASENSSEMVYGHFYGLSYSSNRIPYEAFHFRFQIPNRMG